MKAVFKIVIVTALLSIGFGIYSALSGGDPQTYWFSIFIGIALFGTALIEKKRQRAKKQ